MYTFFYLNNFQAIIEFQNYAVQLFIPSVNNIVNIILLLFNK